MKNKSNNSSENKLLTEMSFCPLTDMMTIKQVGT